MSGPLAGIKVLDLSRILAGPWSTQVLADYGATVWKIEKPGDGDDTRRWGPPFVKDGNGKDTGESAYFIAANRGKKSFEIDITDPKGQEKIRQLATQADILVENYKVDGLKKYNLDFASLHKLNSKLIYCSITGFGQTGPDAKQAGYDAMIQARGGLMSLTGNDDSQPGGGPQKVGVAVADLMTGMYAVSAILAALYHRQQSGEGQHIDLALLDTQVAWLANQSSNYLVSGAIPPRLGSAHPNIVPYQAFATADGHLMLAVGNDSQFARCCEVLGKTELGCDPRFTSNASRVAHRDIIIAELQHLFRMRDTQYWLKALAERNVPCGPINTMAEVFRDPQVMHRNMQFDLPHSSAGKVPQVGNPVKFSRTPIAYEQGPPTLGQHNHELVDET